MATKRIIQLPTLNNGQVTGGNSSQGGYLRRLPNELPGGDGPNPKLVIQTPQTDANGNITGGGGKKTAMNSPEEPEVWTYRGNNGVVQTIDKGVQQGGQPATTYGSKTDRSAAVMSANKNGTTSSLPQATPAGLPGITKYAGIDKNYGNNQAGIDLVNKQSELDTLSEAEKAQRLAGAYNPTPTVATANQPVIKKGVTEEAGVPPIAVDQVASTDRETLLDNIDRLEIKLGKGQMLSDEELLSLRKSKRQLDELAKPQQYGGFESIMNDTKQQIETTKSEETTRNAQELSDYTASQEKRKASQLAILDEQEMVSKKRLASILGGSGQGQSTDTVAQYKELEDNFTLRKQAKIDEMQAKIDLYGAELRKDSRETIQLLEKRLSDQQLKAVDIDLKNLDIVNAYNEKQNLSDKERLQKLQEMSDSIVASNTPLTDAQKADAAMRSNKIIKPDGSFDRELWEILKKQSPAIAAEAVRQSTAIQNERIESELAMKGLDADIKRAQLNKLLNPNKEYDYKQDKDGNRVAIDKNDPTKQIPIGGRGQGNPIISDPTVQTSIAQYSQQQRGRATLQCGELVNDYIKKETGSRGSLGNSFADKVAGIEDIGRSASPVVGGVFAFDIKTSQGNTGHTGIVTGVNPDGSITVLEANRKENSANGGVPSQGTYSPAQVSNMVFSQAPKNNNLSPVAKEAIKSGQINGTPTVQSGIIEELAKAGEFDKGKGNSTFYTAKPAVKDEIASFAEGYAKRQQAKDIFNKLKADGTLGGATGWFDTLANKGKRFAGAGSTDVNNLNQILAESLSKYMNKISGATVSETEVERLREQIPNLSMGDKQFTDAFEQYDLSMQRGLDNTLTKYGFNSYDDVKQKIYGDNKSEQTQATTTTGQISSDRQ